MFVYYCSLEARVIKGSYNLACLPAGLTRLSAMPGPWTLRKVGALFRAWSTACFRHFVLPLSTTILPLQTKGILSYQCENEV